VVVACRSGNRSARATALLVRSGFEAVNLTGGMRAWAAAGLPVETTGAQPGTVV
jgi:rhodanese-related sulfurtransferase